MNRHRLIREVYFEMYRALAGQTCLREILESTVALVKLFTQPEDDSPDSAHAGAGCQHLSNMGIPLVNAQYYEATQLWITPTVWVGKCFTGGGGQYREKKNGRTE
jgi:hypothetical protein